MGVAAIIFFFEFYDTEYKLIKNLKTDENTNEEDNFKNINRNIVGNSLIFSYIFHVVQRER